MRLIQLRAMAGAGSLMRTKTQTLHRWLQNRRIADSRRITQFLCPNLSEKFALLFRCFRLGEFLEARIIPQRIEHRIEPEQRRSERYIWGNPATVWYRE